MSKVALYRSIKQQIASLQAELAKLEGDTQLARELEFEAKVDSLLAEYSLSPARALALLNPDYARKPNSQERRVRQKVIFRNPHSNEIVETKGGNNRILKAWKAQYGADVVQGWKEA